MIYVCKVCGYEYDDAQEDVPFDQLPDDWVCPLCGVGKEMFEAQEPAAAPTQEVPQAQSESEPEATITSSQVMARTYADEGLKVVFGMVGHSNLGMGDAIRQQVEAGHMRYVGIRHEGAAAFAVSAYGKLTGRPAACLTIAGPGATNLATGLCDAKLDGAPALAFMGQVPAGDVDFNIFQECDLKSVYQSIATAQYTLFAESDFAKVAADSYRRAVTEHGVAQVIMPDDVQVVPANEASVPPAVPTVKAAASPEALAAAVALLRAAKRPVLLLGAGARNYAAEALALAEGLNIPICLTYRTKGLIADDVPLCTGLQGRSGNPVAAAEMADCDLIIGVGCGFARHTAIPADKPVIQIDRDVRAFGKRYPVTCPIVSDAGLAMTALLEAAGDCRKESPVARLEAAKAAWREEKKQRAAKSAPGALAPALIGDTLSRFIPENAIVSVDVGNVAYSFGRYFEARHQTFLLSFYLGSIGVGLPSAIGAACATLEDGPFKARPVVAVVGDGGLGQYLADWTTVVKYKLPIKCIVYANAELAKITAEQKLAHVQTWETDLVNPSFADYAKLCGSAGFKVTKSEELEPVLAQAFATPGPVMVEIATDPKQN